MNVTLTGASGFLGKALIARLQAAGHQLHALGRQPIPGLAFSNWNPMTEQPPEAALSWADAIIHLAGEPVAQRWTADAKQRIRDSRILGTRHLVHGLSTLSKRPHVLISASAIGIYGSRGEEVLTEKSATGQGFLAEVTSGWEREASLAESLGLRVVKLRIGVVLGRNGGALEKMLPPFRAGVGGPIASGEQWMSWVHIDDVIGLMVWAMENEQVHGALNATAPNPSRNSEFTAVLGQVLRRPTIMPVPGFALKLLYGEMAEVILGSQRVIPVAAQSGGYPFRFPELTAALEDVLK